MAVARLTTPLYAELLRQRQAVLIIGNLGFGDAVKRQIADAQVAGASAETRHAAAECVAQAEALQTWVANWLKTHKPELP